MANGTLDLSDIQGLILRGYRLPLLRCLVLELDQAAVARQVVLNLASSNPSRLRITNAEDWGAAKPDYCLNLGFTWSGLMALGLGSHAGLSFASFPSFIAGAAARASVLGDTGESAPEHWLEPLGSGRDHAILALYAADRERLAAGTEELRGLLAGGWHVRATLDGAALPDGRVHFGYRDGISQPTVIGGPERNIPDGQPPVPACHFILQADPEAGYYVPTPEVLGLNGSFGVFRVLRQDVGAFERFLESQRQEIDPELLAAKICGRWRNGVPLSLSPDSDQTAIPEDGWNDFDYVAGRDGVADDRRGERCPIGAHIRRSFPRGMRVQGGGNHQHRLIRRGMPYGAPYDRERPDDASERGLLGFFINASIEQQYEFVAQMWCNQGGFAAGLPADSKDLLAGGEPAAGARLELKRAGGQPPLSIGGFQRFVQTRGGAYCFLPSLSALRFIGTFTQ